jgi:hypothetical protein
VVLGPLELVEGRDEGVLVVEVHHQADRHVVVAEMVEEGAAADVLSCTIQVTCWTASMGRPTAMHRGDTKHNSTTKILESVQDDCMQHTIPECILQWPLKVYQQSAVQPYLQEVPT